MKDASTCVTIETRNGSTSTSDVIETQVKMKNASTCVTIETKDKSTSTSFVIVKVDSETQVDMEDSTLCVTIESKNGSTSASVDVDIGYRNEDEARRKASFFDEVVRCLPYDEKAEIITLDKNLMDSKLSSKMVSLITTPINSDYVSENSKICGHVYRK